MKKTMLILASLAVFAAARAEEFEFDKKLTGWEKHYPAGLSLDEQVKVSAAGSLSLTGGKDRPYANIGKQLDLQPNTKYDISLMVKGSGITGTKTGLYLNAGKKWDCLVRWKGTFDWEKYTGVLDTGKMGSGKVKLFFTLFGNEGKLWIDNLSITPAQQEKKACNYEVKFYPVNVENNRMAICENLPGILMLLSKAPASFKEHYRDKASSMDIDVPEFLKLMGVHSGFQSRWAPMYNNVKKMTLTKSFVRDGVKYQRYHIEYGKFLALQMCFYPFTYHHLFEAVPGSAGKTGKIYWSFDISGEKHPEQVFSVEVLPPAAMTEPPCREFGLSLSRSYILNQPFISKRGFDSTMKFWASLTDKRSYTLKSPISHIKTGIGGTPKVYIGGNDCVNPWNYKELVAMRKKMPTDMSLKGAEPRGKDVSAWALVDDPDKIFETYLRNTFRLFKTKFPEACKNLEWDIEPFGFGMEGCDEGGRKRFAEKMKLKSVPTIAEINGKYKDLHFQYMMKLHTELIRKVTRIYKEEIPGGKMWLCSGNLEANPPHYSRWACIDIRQVDDVIDIHYHMPYYTGTRFYDDVAYNTKHLKKPSYMYHYPSYKKPSFDYTPDRLVQNVVASASLGCIGASFGESDIFSGHYFHALAKMYSMISRAEKYYFHGKRCDEEITVTPKNAISRKLSNGQTITSPDFSQVIRYTVHKLDGKYFITLLNYHKTLPLIAEISGKDFKPVLVKVAPEGCEQIGPGLIPPQKPLRKEIAAYAGQGDAFKDHVSGQNKAAWTVSAKGQAMLRLSDGKISAGVDSLGSGEVISLRNESGRELLTDGFIGRIMFLDRLQPKLVWKTERYGLEKDNAPYLISAAEVGPYEGAMPEPNPLLGMKILRKYSVRNGKLQVSFRFVNPSKKEMPILLRLNNLPWPGFRFKAKNMVLNGKYDLNSAMSLTIPADGKPVTLKAAEGGLSDEIVFQPKTKFKEVFSWNDRRIRKTIEFMMDCKLAPGAALTGEYDVTIK